MLFARGSRAYSLLIGGLLQPPDVDLWEPDDGRLSRPVLREPGGEIPPGYSTSSPDWWGQWPAHRRRGSTNESADLPIAEQSSPQPPLSGYEYRGHAASPPERIGGAH